MNKFSRKTRLVLLTVLGVIIVLAVITAVGLFLTGHMPDTLYRDENGLMHGTGWERYHYASGAVKLEEYYTMGRLDISRWLHPDGSVVAETHWRDGVGVGYSLREDGSIRVAIEYQNYLAHGRAVYYNEDGVTIDRVTEFREGKEVENES